MKKIEKDMGNSVLLLNFGLPRKQKLFYAKECTTFAFPNIIKDKALAAFNCIRLRGSYEAGAFPILFTSKCYHK